MSNLEELIRERVKRNVNGHHKAMGVKFSEKTVQEIEDEIVDRTILSMNNIRDLYEEILMKRLFEIFDKQWNE
jgi:hypothetical protein